MADRLEFNLELSRIASEIRFRPNLASWGNILATAKNLETSYEHWKINESKTEDILLFSPKDKASIRICYNKIIYIQEGSLEVGKLNKHLDSSFKQIGVDMKVPEVQHVGFRQVLMYKCKLKFSELAQVLYERLYNQSFIEQLPVETGDTMLYLNGDLKGKSLKYHLRIAPMVAEEAWGAFESPFEKINPLSSDFSYLHIDLDVYSQSEKKPELATSVKNDCIKYNTQILEAVLGKLQT